MLCRTWPTATWRVMTPLGWPVPSRGVQQHRGVVFRRAAANVCGRERPAATASGIGRICNCDRATVDRTVASPSTSLNSTGIRASARALTAAWVRGRSAARMVASEFEERKGQFFTGSPAVDGDHDRTDLDGCGEGDDPVGTVAHRNGQPIAGHDAEYRAAGWPTARRRRRRTVRRSSVGG